MNLHRFVYCSNFALKSRGTALAAELKRILGSAIRHNEADDISGGLVFSRRHFLQVLEGDQKALASTLSRIMVDPRHTEIILIEAKPITKRTFGAWSMGYGGNAALFDTICDAVTADGVIDPSRISADDLVASIHRLVESEMHMAKSRSIEVV